MFWIFTNPGKIKELAEKGQTSKLAELCPTCDERMAVEKVGLEVFWYRCKKCNGAFPIKIQNS